MRGASARGGSETDALWRAARALARRAPLRQGAPALPPLLFFTDPARTPDPVAVAERLPPGAGVVYRHFGAADSEVVASALAKLARRRGLTLLIGDDEGLAEKVGAHGLHLPERRLSTAPRIRARHPAWVLTGAAHAARALMAARTAGLDAAVLSPVFASRSPSAGRPLGALRATALVRRASLPVYALGGVNARTARRLGSGWIGVAAVDGLVAPSTADKKAEESRR